MFKRIITGAVLIAIVVGVLFLRSIDTRLFNIATFGFMVIGTFEVSRALKDKQSFLQRTIVMVFAIACVPTYVFFGKSSLMALTFTAMLLCACTIVLEFEKTTLENVALSIFNLFYPSILIFPLMLINDMHHGLIALLLTFTIGPMADTMAFFVGSAIKGRKLSPKISPKKTVSGAIGGVIGGVIGSVAIWAIFGKNLFSSSVAVEVLLFTIIGILGSLATEFGDLLEGAIKRKVGIKDMGNIFPGHGGVLDRIDGIMVNAVFIFIIFTLIG